MTPDQYCAAKAGESGSSFYASFRFLPDERRRALTALYAFCREVDDVVDRLTHAEVARVKLGWWREEIARLFEDAPRHPVTRALQPAIRAYDLPQSLFVAVIEGMEMDLTHMRYADFAALERYCDRVAGAVGLLSARIFGFSDARTLDFARALGMAFQLTNIVRDVGEDAVRGRIYLPQNELREYGVAEDDILHGREGESLYKLMRFQAQRAYGYYDAAMQALPAVDRRAQLPSLMMSAIYRTLLDEIVADGFHVLRHRIALPRWRKLYLAWRTLWRERRA